MTVPVRTTRTSSRAVANRITQHVHQMAGGGGLFGNAVPEAARTKVAAEFPTHHRSCAAAGADGSSSVSSRTESFTHGPDTVFTSTWTTNRRWVTIAFGQLRSR